MSSSDFPFSLPHGLNNNKATILAPWLYGSIVGSVLVGILLMQTALYYARYPKDRLYYKITVGLLALLSIISWSATLFILYHAFIDGFGSVVAMHAWPRATFVPVAVPAFSGTISQSFFATRIYRLSGQKRWLGVGLLALLLTSFVAGVASIAMEPRSQSTPMNRNDVLLFKLFDPAVEDIFTKVITAIQVFLWVQAATDVILSSLLVYFLLSERRKGDKQMGTTLTRVLVMGLTTGGITALFSVAEGIIVLSTIWSNNVNMGLTLSLTHVYSLVCISSLNVRRAINTHHKGSSAGVSSGGLTRPSMAAFASPISEKPSLSSLRLTASQQATAATLTAGAPPFAYPRRPQPPKLNTRDISSTTDRFESAHALETAQTGSTALSPEDYKSVYPVLKGDAADQVTMPRFSYLPQHTPPKIGIRRERPRRPPFTYNGTPV